MKKRDKISQENLKEIYMNIEKQAIVGNYTLPQKPSKDGYYRVYVQDGNKRKQLFAKTIEELADKIYYFEKEHQKDKTFKDIFNIVEGGKLKFIKDEERKLSAINTIDKHKSEYKRFFSGTEFESKDISEITKSDIEEILLFNLNRYNLKRKGFVAMCSILRSVFRYAYEEYLIVDNSFLRLDLHKFDNMLDKKTPIADRAYNDSELLSILEYLRDYERRRPEHIPPYAVECQILMGLRRGEVPPIKWEDFDGGNLLISKEQLSVRKNDETNTTLKIVSHTKTDKNRLFPIVGEVKDFFNKMRYVHDLYFPDSEFVFPSNTSSTGAVSNNAIYNCYSTCIKALGIKRDVTMGTHSFRRNAITDAVNNTNGNLILVSELYGNSPEVIRSNYFTGIDMTDASIAIGKRKLTKS